MTLIDRVAAAMWLRSHDSPWESASRAQRSIYLADARAAVEAMSDWLWSHNGDPNAVEDALAEYDQAQQEDR